MTLARICRAEDEWAPSSVECGVVEWPGGGCELACGCWLCPNHSEDGAHHCEAPRVQARYGLALRFVEDAGSSPGTGYDAGKILLALAEALKAHSRSVAASYGKRCDACDTYAEDCRILELVEGVCALSVPLPSE